MAYLSLGAGSGGDGTANPQADRYQKEVITQVINEYDDLAGIGITLGERMENLGESTANLTAQLDWCALPTTTTWNYLGTCCSKHLAVSRPLDCAPASQP